MRLLALLAAALAPGLPQGPWDGAQPLAASLARGEEEWRSSFGDLRAAFARRNPGYDLDWAPTLSEARAVETTLAIFVQSGKGRARIGAASSEVGVGDLVLLRRGEELGLDPPVGALIVRVPADPPAELPAFIRPDWDTRITDTPGGCATETGAYRRILVTWSSEVGPYVWRALNAHRVRIQDSFTHYHPREGGFDELYLVQMAGGEARLLSSIRTDEILRGGIGREELAGVLQERALEPGDLVYLPRGVAHRGMGGALVQVITVPGFVPGAEIPLDRELQSVNERLGLSAREALRFHAEPPGRGVRLAESEGSVRIEIDGALFSEYRTGGVPKPFFHPLVAPSGARLTRGFPMEEIAGETRDHPHHRGLWFAHGAVNGVDFWTEGAGRGTIRCTGTSDSTGGLQAGSFRARHEWVDASGKVVCTDERRFLVRSPPVGRILDVEIALIASHGEMLLGDTKEGTFAVRVADSMRVEGGGGHIANSEGARDGDAWGKRARWVDYAGPVGEGSAGIAIFDHPANLRHPTWWHVRGYGLFAANPFGAHDFEGAPKGSGDLKLAAGERLVLRYRVLLHSGALEPARLEALWREWAGG